MLHAFFVKLQVVSKLVPCIVYTSMEPLAKQRKRNAVGSLKGLASELGIVHGFAGSSDLTRDDFVAFQKNVLAKSTTPEHRSRADAALQLYLGNTPSQAKATLPKVPALPSVLPQAPPATAAGSTPSQGSDAGFRLRSIACLFTWNSSAFADMDPETLFFDFLGWLRGLAFIARWTATLEQSLKSQEKGRLHLHAFVEFHKAPDWNTLEKVRFAGSLPDARPTHARGEKESMETIKNQGHFYCWAAKPGTLKVQTSGHEPWQDYCVMGRWIDTLWSQQKLDHDTYIAYAAKVAAIFVSFVWHWGVGASGRRRGERGQGGGDRGGTRR